mgnify:FL=1
MEANHIDYTEGQEEQMIGQQEEDEVGPFDGLDDEPLAMRDEASLPVAMLSSPTRSIYLYLELIKSLYAVIKFICKSVSSMGSSS